jgi:hypothetical protein
MAVKNYGWHNEVAAKARQSVEDGFVNYPQSCAARTARPTSWPSSAKCWATAWALPGHGGVGLPRSGSQQLDAFGLESRREFVARNGQLRTRLF